MNNIRAKLTPQKKIQVYNVGVDSVVSVSNIILRVDADNGPTESIPLGTDNLFLQGSNNIFTTTGDDRVVFDLADTTVTADTYGDALNIPVITVDSKGRITEANTVPIDITEILLSGRDAIFGDVTVEGRLFSDDITASTITAQGNFIAAGEATFTSDNINLQGNSLTFNSAIPSVANPSEDVSIIVKRGSEPSAILRWDETNNRWTFSGDDVVTGGLTATSISGTTGTFSGLVTSNGLETGDISANAGTFSGLVTSNELYTGNISGNDVTVRGLLLSNDLTANNVTIDGNLTVLGQTTTVNTEEINLADNIILLNSNLGALTAPSQNAGIEINRGSANNVSLYWDEVNDRWSVGDESFFAGAFIGDFQGNADTANRLANTVVIALSGLVTGNTVFDGSQDVTIDTTIEVINGGTY